METQVNIEINKEGVYLTPNKWSYEERRLYKYNNNRYFEKNYSKWATIQIDKFEDISIIKETKETDYLIELSNDTHYVSAIDTCYEYYWGNKSLKKKFDKETDGYGRIEDYIDDKYIEEVKYSAIISKEDYFKLKEYFEELDKKSLSNLNED